jgi:hypothetical protein
MKSAAQIGDSQSPPSSTVPEEHVGTSACEYVKLICACIIVTLLIVIAFTGIILQYNVLQIFPLANFALLFLATTLLGKDLV